MKILEFIFNWSLIDLKGKSQFIKVGCSASQRNAIFNKNINKFSQYECLYKAAITHKKFLADI